MKEIKVIAWCDGNHDEGEMIQADGAVTIAFGKGKPRTVDLCKSCNEDMIEPVMAMFGQFGVTDDGSISTGLAGIEPRRRARKPNPPCPDCGHQSPNRSALGTHMKNRHDKGLKDYPGF